MLSVDFIVVWMHDVISFLRERRARRRAGHAKWMPQSLTVSKLPPAEPVALAPVKLIRATLNHRGYQVCTDVPDHIQTITVPVFVAGGFGQYVYRRTDECLPIGDGLAVVFALDGEPDDE